jgi:hypothetical protein
MSMSIAGLTNAVVFSKDRPAQLDLFLASLKKYWPELPISVLYKHTNDTCKHGYQKAHEYHLDAQFIQEESSSFLRKSSFKKTILKLLDPTKQLTMFFVDDIIFMATPDEHQISQALNHSDVLCTSLRMAPHYDWCYTQNTSMTPPEFDARMTWLWDGAGPAWDYPMSVDGHIYRTKEILSMIKSCSFRNPNQLEHQLNQCTIPRPRMHCLKYASMVNNPANRVQNEFKNIHANQSLDELNTRFLAGERLDPECVHTVEHRGPHTEFPLQFRSKEHSTP